MRRAVYAGSFDPPTNGHLWVLKQGANQFDKLIVAVGTNPDKNYTFAEDERVCMLETLCRWVSTSIEVARLNDDLLVHFAQKAKAQFLLRGIRNVDDFWREMDMRDENYDIDPTIETVLVFPPLEFRRISSSFVKGLVKSNRWEERVKKHLPPYVYEEFVKRFGK